ncbi:unnamed protein product, partial [Rotaria magnacalcarata]
RKKRYDINNMLICSVSTGDEKPKKDEYSTILQDIVNELRFLEQVGFDVLLPSTVKTNNRTYTHFHAFAIAAVCDKPAQAIMMNIKDPAGFFSCGCWCCIPDELLKCIRYPTTNRLPRALKYYTTWKANEYRMTLLFGYKPFEQVMKKKYYEHFRLLVYAAIFSETRILTTTRLDHIKHLLNKFLDEFSALYGASNCVSIVHSLSHIHQYLVKCGPIHNYSTFNFESTVGSLVKSIHGPSFILKQLINNFEHQSYATTILKNPAFHPKIALLIHQIFSSKRRAIPTSLMSHNVVCLSRSTVSAFPHVTEYLENIYTKDQYTHYSTCFYRNVAFTVHHSKHTQVDNSTVIYFDHFNNLHIGIIIGIIQLKTTKDIIFIIDQAEIVGFDTFSLDQIEYVNDFLVYAKHSNPPTIVSIGYKTIKEKVAYRKDPKVKTSAEFYIFPNLVENM